MGTFEVISIIYYIIIIVILTILIIFGYNFYNQGKVAIQPIIKLVDKLNKNFDPN